MHHHDVELLQRLDEDELEELCEALEVPPSEIGWRTNGRQPKGSADGHLGGPAPPDRPVRGP